MACPGGCIGGGGQPYHHGDVELLKLRTKVLYDEDAGKPLRKSHQNPYIIERHEKFLGSHRPKSRITCCTPATSSAIAIVCYVTAQEAIHL
jgi:iron only hydrogenase large subunit-like protein